MPYIFRNHCIKARTGNIKIKILNVSIYVQITCTRVYAYAQTQPTTKIRQAMLSTSQCLHSTVYSISFRAYSLSLFVRISAKRVHQPRGICLLVLAKSRGNIKAAPAHCEINHNYISITAIKKFSCLLACVCCVYARLVLQRVYCLSRQLHTINLHVRACTQIPLE